MAGKRKIGQASITVVPELKTDKAQKKLDELTKPKEVEIVPKLNTQKVFGDIQKILDKPVKQLQDALDFKNLADQMQGYINGLAKTVDKGLSGSLQATLDDFQGRFEAMSFSVDGGKMLSYSDAIKEEIKAIEQVTATKKKYYDINEKIAKTAKENRSHWGYEEGSATASYRASVDRMIEIAEEKKKKHPDKAEKLDQWVDRYAKNLAQYINRDNEIGAQYPSAMISGPANYNIKKHNRQMASWGKNFQFYEEKVAALEKQIMNVGGTGTEVIRGDESDSLEKIKAKVEYLKYFHEVMKEANKYYKKNKTLEGFDGAEPDEIEKVKQALADQKRVGMYDTPYPSYELTNNRQNIERLEGRITELKRLKDESKSLFEENEFYKLWEDKEAMRIRIEFDADRVPREVWDLLRQNAFKKTKEGIFQRQLTDNARSATKRLQGKLHDFYGIGDVPTAVEPVVEVVEQVVETSKPVENIAGEQAQANSKLASSYEDLAEAVEGYIKACEKLVRAYYKEEDFNAIAQERNSAIEAIAGYFPDKVPDGATQGMSAHLMRDGITMMLQDFHQTQLYASTEVEQALDVIKGMLSDASKELAISLKSMDFMSYDEAVKWSNFAAYPHTSRSDEDKKYLEDHSDDVLSQLERRSQALSENLKPVDEMVSRISRNASAKDIPWDQQYQAAADVAKQLSEMYEQGITDTEEYITLQYKLVNIYDKIIKSAGGVKGSGAENATTLRQWINDSVLRETGYSIGGSYAVDALWGQGKFSIYETNSQTKSMVELAGELLGYKGFGLSGGFGAKYDKSELKRLNSTTKILKEYIEEGIAAEQMVKTTELLGELQQKFDPKDFKAIFGETMDSFGGLNVSNALAMYDALITKEKEYTAAIIARANAANEFTQVNAALAQEHQNSEEFKETWSRLIQEINNGKIPLEEANSHIQALAESLAQAAKTPVHPFGDEDDVNPMDEVYAKVAQLANLTEGELNAAFKGVEFDKFLSELNIVGEDADKIKEKFVALLKATEAGDTSAYTSIFEDITNDIIKLGHYTVNVTKDFEKFRQHMQGRKLLYNDAVKAAYGGKADWQAFYRGDPSLGIVKHQDYVASTPNVKTGSVIDLGRSNFWEELVGIFPELFPDAEMITDVADQFKAIHQVWDLARAELGAESFKSIGLGESDRAHINNSLSEKFALSSDQIYAHRAEQDAIAEAARKAAEEKAREAAAIEAAKKKEEELGDVARETTGVLEEQAGAAEKTAENLGDRKDGQIPLIDDEDSSGQKEAEDTKVNIIQKTVDDALAQLRNAKNAATLPIDLTDLQYTDDLKLKIGQLVKDSLGADLSVGAVDINDDIATISLYNKELGVTTEQIWQLKAATDAANGTELEFVDASHLRVNFEKAAAYAEAQEKKLANSEKFLIAQQKRLDSLQRSYQHGSKTLGDKEQSLLVPDMTTLADNADKTLDGLAKHIQERIKSLSGKVLGQGEQNDFLRDLNALENEIRTKQLDKYKSGNMSSTEVEQLRKGLTAMLDTLASKARKNNAFDAISKSYTQLWNNLNKNDAAGYFTDDKLDDAVQQMRTFSKEVTKEMSFASEAKADEQAYNNLLHLQERLYDAKKKVADLDVQGKTDTAAGMKASRVAEELEQQYKAAVDLLKTDEQKASIKERELKLEKELAAVRKESSSTDVQAVDPIKQTYQSLVDTITKINEVSSNIASYQKADGGSGVLSTYIGPLQEQRQALIGELTSIIGDVDGILSEGLLKGKDVSLPNIQSLGVDLSSVKEFLSSTKAQASLTNEEISQLVTLLQKTQGIEVKVLSEQFKAIAEQAKQANKEAQYFSEKTVHSDGDSITSSTSQYVAPVDKARQQLEAAAKAFAQNSGSDAFIKSFTRSADGISHLDFSVFDKATNSMKSFRMEMGTTSDQIYRTETTISKSFARMQAASKLHGNIGDLLGKIDSSNIDNTLPKIQKLHDLAGALSQELAKGDGADQTVLARFMQESKLAAAEVEKLYKKHLQLQSAIDSGDAQSLGAIKLDGNIYSQMTDSINKFATANGGAEVKIGKFNEVTNQLKFTMQSADGTLKEFTVSLDRLGQQAVVQQTNVTNLGTKWQQLKQGLAGLGKQFLTAFAGANIFYSAISQFRKGFTYVKEIDLALTELKKVTSETEETYRKFLQTASETSAVIGSTVSDFTDATAAFARLGYTIEESTKMAETAIVYKNVADGLDTVEESTDSIISTMMAYGIAADDTMSIIDKFNAVGNNFAITSAGIGDAMQRSASALKEGGNSIDESIGLITAANSVIQNPEQVGTALKTLSLRIRGVKTELEEAGLETEGMAETTAQLQAKLKALTHGKVDIMLDADTFKNTTQVLREMSAAWEDMTDVERAAALELLGGKRQAKQHNCPNVQKCA